MNVLLTGGTGYIGSHTCVRLIELGLRPVLLDNFANSKRAVLDRIERVTGVRPAFFEVDIRDRVRLDEVLAARCPGCSYTYEVAVGNELEGFAAGTAWKEIPDDWCCPDCGVREKLDFEPVA